MYSFACEYFDKIKVKNNMYKKSIDENLSMYITMFKNKKTTRLFGALIAREMVVVVVVFR